MTTYCIGDVHACFDEFQALLNLIGFNSSRDRLFLTGDVIGRGPKPVKTMEYLLSHQDTVKTVLGNHDLNFLCISYGGGTLRPKDNLKALMDSPHFDSYVNYLSHCPLMIIDEDQHFSVTHAGLYPLWSMETAMQKSQLIARMLDDKELSKLLFNNMYGDSPDKDDGTLQDIQLWRFILNAFTRMRFVYRDYRLDYLTKAKKPSDMKDDSLMPWFNFKSEYKYKGEDYNMVFGHWAALQGECYKKNVMALDTACIWGDRLTCYCVDTDQYYWVKSRGYSTFT